LKIKTSRKHAEKLAGVAKIEKEEKKSKETQPKTDRPLDEKVTITEGPLRPRSEASESRSNERNESNESNVLPTTEETQHDASATLEKKAETAKTEKKTSDSSDSSVTSVTSTKKHQSKKYIAAKKSVEPKIYGAKEALSLLPKTSTVKFDASVEVHLNVIDKSVRAKVNSPHNAGAKKKEKKYLIFTDKRLTIHDKHIIWGDEKTIAEIESAKLKPGKDFDVVVASPKYMPLLAKIAKVWPAVPQVPSMKFFPGCTFKYSVTSLTRTGICTDNDLRNTIYDLEFVNLKS